MFSPCCEIIFLYLTDLSVFVISCMIGFIFFGKISCTYTKPLSCSWEFSPILYENRNICEILYIIICDSLQSHNLGHHKYMWYILPVAMYKLLCYSLNLATLSFPMVPVPCLHCCPANRFISTTSLDSIKMC